MIAPTTKLINPATVIAPWLVTNASVTSIATPRRRRASPAS